MKQPKPDYYVQVQRRKTIKYRATQHYQDYLTIPAKMSQLLGLQPGQAMRCTLNSDRESLSYTKVVEKPLQKKMTYEEWRDRIHKFIPSANEDGKPFEEIRKEAGIPMLTAPALWVRLAEAELGLTRKRDQKTHRIIWSLASATKLASGKPKIRDVKLTDLFALNERPLGASSPLE